MKEKPREDAELSVSLRTGGTSPSGTGAVTVTHRHPRRWSRRDEVEPGSEEPGGAAAELACLACSGEALQTQRSWDKWWVWLEARRSWVPRSEGCSRGNAEDGTDPGSLSKQESAGIDNKVDTGDGSGVGGRVLR